MDKFTPIFIKENKQKIFIGNKQIKIKYGLLASKKHSILTINCSENLCVHLYFCYVHLKF